MTDPDLHDLALKSALKNALEHKGKASAPAVLSKVIGEHPELRSQVNELKAIIQVTVEDVNAMSVDEQRKELGEAASALIGRKRPSGSKGLPPLPGAVKGQVVTRLAPEPSGYMHLGHAMSFLLNFLYARMYEGEVWLRFEDTDPRKVKEKYYESFRSGCKWLGIEWDHEKNNSDSISSYYEAGEKLIEEGGAYMCTCPVPELRKLRAAGADCAHRALGKDEVKALWQRMHSDLKEGEGVLRLRGDMASQNYVMRDPILFRIIDQPHPLTDKLFRVWPTYDMSASIEDSTCGVTHVLRSNEFALRGELQNRIRTLLGLRSPTIIEYSRFTFQGTPVGKRKLRPLIEAHLVSGWDDPRMPTVEGAMRRGLVPEAIREFTTANMAFTNTRKEYDWDLLFAVNRKILDPITRRYFFVPRPAPLLVQGAPALTVSLRNHPDKDLGRRGVPVDDEFYIAGDDAKGLSNGDTIRLKDLYNVTIEEVSAEGIRAEFIGRELVEGVPKIQWVTGENVPAEVLVPGPLFIGEEFNSESLGHISGLAEKSVAELKVGEIIQFERFGFCRLDSKTKVETFVFVHR